MGKTVYPVCQIQKEKLEKINYQRMHQYLLIDVVLMTLLVINHKAEELRVS